VPERFLDRGGVAGNVVRAADDLAAVFAGDVGDVIGVRRDDGRGPARIAAWRGPIVYAITVCRVSVSCSYPAILCCPARGDDSYDDTIKTPYLVVSLSPLSCYLVKSISRNKKRDNKKQENYLAGFGDPVLQFNDVIISGNENVSKEIYSRIQLSGALRFGIITGIVNETLQRSPL